MLLSLIVFFSCKGVEPAPEDLDSLHLYMRETFDDDDGQASRRESKAFIS